MPKRCCEDCGGDWPHQFEIGWLCLGCWEKRQGIEPEPVKPKAVDQQFYEIESTWYEIGTGRTTLAHPNRGS